MTALVVYAHPLEGSLASAVRDRVVAGLAAGGAEVDLVDLHADAFDPVLGEEAWRAHGIAPTADPVVAAYGRRLAAADTVVFVHPTWWGGPPAIVKGFVDRVFCAGVAFVADPGADRIRGTLGHVRDLAVFATHGSPWRTNKLLEREPGRLMVSRQLRLLCGWRTRVTWEPLYGVDRSTPADRAAYLARAEATAVRLGRRSARRSR